MGQMGQPILVGHGSRTCDPLTHFTLNSSGIPCVFWFMENQQRQSKLLF